MRRPEKALTAAFVKHASEPGKYFDGNGLYLRVADGGSKYWVQRIVIRRRRREIGLGNPTIVSLGAARDLAIENLRAARGGRDPILEKKRAQAVLSFEETARIVHELHKPTWRNAKHADDFINSLESYAFPKIGGLRAAEVTAADVLSVLTPIWTAKAETARRVRQRIGTVLKYAKAQGWRLDNPAEDIQQALPKVDRTKKRRRSLHYAEVSKCIEAVQSSRAWPVTKLAIEFLVLTAARSGEVRGAQWKEIERQDGPQSGTIWLLPPERMKAKREHRVPLPPRALEILKEAAAFKDDTGLLFPSPGGQVLSDMTLSKLVKELGFEVDIHGFRSSFRTWVQEKTSFPREVAEAALAHSIGDEVEAAYARSDFFEKRRLLMTEWSNFVATSAAVL